MYQNFLEPYWKITVEMVQRVWEVQSMVRLNIGAYNKDFATVLSTSGRQEAIASLGQVAAITDGDAAAPKVVLQDTTRPKMIMPTVSFTAPPYVTPCGKVLEPQIFIDSRVLVKDTTFVINTDFYNDATTPY